MSTPSIQTLITQAQQVLNLKSSNEIRATLAAVLANANVGTPLNPNLTTQQLWDEFYEIVRQPSDDIMSIITDQMMRMVFSPPAPGGAGADKQVIFNDGGVLSGDPDLIFNKALNKLVANNIETAAGLLVGTSATITGALTVGNGTSATQTFSGVTNILDIGYGSLRGGSAYGDVRLWTDRFRIYNNAGTQIIKNISGTNGDETWYDGAGGTRMTLNSTGLGIGGSPTGVAKLYAKSGAVTLGAVIETGGASSLLSFADVGTSSYTRVQIGSVGNTLVGIINGTQAMTLDASGNLLVGDTTSPLASRLSLFTTFAQPDGIVIRNTGATAGLYWRFGAVNNSNTLFVMNASSVGVTMADGASAWSSVSDERLKDIIEPISNAVAKVGSLRSVIGKYKSDSEGTRRSFLIAQDVKSVLPEAVDSTDIESLGLRYTEVIPLLVSAIQELTARVQTLEAR